MQLALGFFIFQLQTAPFTSLDRQTGYRHVFNEVVGARALGQFIGAGEDKISIAGRIVPEFGNRMSLTLLRTMADMGKSWSLISGGGFLFGLYVIDSIQENQTLHDPSGNPLAIDFTLSLTRADDDIVADMIGSALNGIADAVGATDTTGMTGPR